MSQRTPLVPNMVDEINRHFGFGSGIKLTRRKGDTWVEVLDAVGVLKEDGVVYVSRYASNASGKIVRGHATGDRKLEVVAVLLNEFKVEDMDGKEITDEFLKFTQTLGE